MSLIFIPFPLRLTRTEGEPGLFMRIAMALLLGFQCGALAFVCWLMGTMILAPEVTSAAVGPQGLILGGITFVGVATGALILTIREYGESIRAAENFYAREKRKNRWRQKVRT